MKKFSLFLAILMLLTIVTSCSKGNDTSDVSETGSGTSTDTSSDSTNFNLINSVDSVDNALIYELDRSKEYKKVNIINGDKYTLQTEASTTFPDDGKKLTDDVIATIDADSINDWIGFVAKKEVEFTVELNEKTSGIAEMGINIYYDPSQSRTAPKTVKYYISDDGTNFTYVGASGATNDYSDKMVYTHLLVLQKGVEAKYIKVIISDITSNWVQLDSFQAYVYDDPDPIDTSEYYENEPLPKNVEPEYWSSSESDYNDRINLALGLSQRIYSLIPLLEAHMTDYFNTPASTPKLTDGKKGGKTYTDTNFVHFTRGLGREIIYDLGKISAVDSVTIGSLVESSTGISLPAGFHVSVSENGEDWQNVYADIPDNPDNIDNDTVRITADFGDSYKARFVRITFLTPGHVWVDEIEIFGTKNIDDAKDLVPDDDTGVLNGQYPTSEKLDGVENILLAYNFYNENKEVGLTSKDEYLPYVGYYDTEGNLVDTFFDSYLYLPCHTTCTSGGVLYYDKSKPSYASDWLEYEEDLFAEGYNVNALNEAVGEIKTKLSFDDYQATIFFPIFSTVPTQTNFGDIDNDGVSEDFSNIENRKKAIKWWIDRLILKYESSNYENLKLNGFYWYHEALELSDSDELELIQFTSDYVHSLGYHIIWIPYYQAGGFSEWKTAGFDVANMQPNYTFNAESTEQVLYDNASIAKQLGMGVEIEIDGKALINDEYYNRYLAYLRVGVETGYVKGIKMYYQDAGPGTYYNAYVSEDKKIRNIYDITYLYAKDKLSTELSDIDQTKFSTAKDTILTNSIRISNLGLPITVKLEVSPKYGKLALSDGGSFTYEPMADFTGTDKFYITVSTGIATATFKIVVTVE